MTLDDTEEVKRLYGKITPVTPENLRSVIDVDARLKKEFEAGDTLYFYSTVSCLAGSFGYLRVHGRQIVKAYRIGVA